VPVARFWARKEIATEPAKEEVFRVPLRPFTMPGETLPSAESGLGAYDALQHADDPALSLFWRGYEEALLPLSESRWDPKPVLLRILPLPVHGGVDNVRLFHHVACRCQIYTLLTPLDPGQLSLRSSPHQCLLDTWSRQELVVNFVRDRGREHPRSASRHLGFTINSCKGPVSGLLVGLTCGPGHLQDPIPPLLDPPGRAGSISVISYFGEAIVGFFCTARTLPKNCPRKFRHVRVRDVLAGTGTRHAEVNCARFGRPAVTTV